MLLLLIIVSFYSLVSFGQPADVDPIEATITSIQKEIGDLTNLVEPLNSKTFLAARKSMTKATAEQIIKLIQQKRISGTQSEIGVLLLSGLPEDIYLNTTRPLVAASTQEDVLKDLLMPPLPYGPGYANACKEPKFKEVLVGLKTNAACGKEVKTVLDLIISGEASRIYSNYRRHPDQYGY
jgi:hypothetical protein